MLDMCIKLHCGWTSLLILCFSFQKVVIWGRKKGHSWQLSTRHLSVAFKIEACIADRAEFGVAGEGLPGKVSSWNNNTLLGLVEYANMIQLRFYN